MRIAAQLVATSNSQFVSLLGYFNWNICNKKVRALG